MVDSSIQHERDKERWRKYYHAHSSSRLAYHKAWYKTKKAKARRKAAQERRKARLALTPAHMVMTWLEWEEILTDFKHCCAYCGGTEDEKGPMQQDHVIPVAKGGLHTADNVVPCCGDCNRRKATKTLPSLDELDDEP